MIIIIIMMVADSYNDGFVSFKKKKLKLNGFNGVNPFITIIK